MPNIIQNNMTNNNLKQLLLAVNIDINSVSMITFFKKENFTVMKVKFLDGTITNFKIKKGNEIDKD